MASNSSSSSREGPTILWTMLKGKKVKSNDGKDVADAYDGKVLWLLVSEEEILGKYHHGSEPPGDQYARDFESFKSTPYGQKSTYNPDSDQNVRVVEEYKNVRDLK